MVSFDILMVSYSYLCDHLLVSFGYLWILLDPDPHSSQVAFQTQVAVS